MRSGSSEYDTIDTKVKEADVGMQIGDHYSPSWLNPQPVGTCGSGSYIQVSQGKTGQGLDELHALHLPPGLIHAPNVVAGFHFAVEYRQLAYQQGPIVWVLVRGNLVFGTRH